MKFSGFLWFYVMFFMIFDHRISVIYNVEYLAFVLKYDSMQFL